MARTTRKRKAFSRQRPVYFREWREFRDLKIEAAAEKLDMSYPNLSRIELGNGPYTEKTLNRMADLYRCTPCDLLMRDPNNPDTFPWSIWDQIRQEMRPRAKEILEVLVNTG